MNYQVPQFIEVEDKIFGQLTIKQFIYVAGGIGISFAIYVYVPVFFIALTLIIVVMAFSLALAFYKINNKPFINVVESAFKYLTSKKLYLWKKAEVSSQNLGKISETKKISAVSENGEDDSEIAKLAVPKLSESKLKDLSWSLDVQESLYSAYSKDKRSQK